MTYLTKKERISSLEKQNEDFERRIKDLEAIINPPTLVELVSVKELDEEVFTGLPPEWRWATVDMNRSVWVWKSKPKVDELKNHWNSQELNGMKLQRKDYRPVDWRQAILYRKRGVSDSNNFCERLLGSQEAVMCKCSMNKEVNRHYTFDRVTHADSDGFHTSTGKVWNYVIPVDSQGNDLKVFVV